MAKKKYQGQLLAANPNNPIDELSRSVILIISHTPGVTVGLQLNHPIEGMTIQSVASDLGLWWPGDDPLLFGGGANNNKIHVIHSNDWAGLTTIKINDEISVTNDLSILAALNRGEGPAHYRACAGYWIWVKGQLDKQLEAGPSSTVEHRWEVVPATFDNIFNCDYQDHWISTLEESARTQVSMWLS